MPNQVDIAAWQLLAERRPGRRAASGQKRAPWKALERMSRSVLNISPRALKFARVMAMGYEIKLNDTW